MPKAETTLIVIDKTYTFLLWSLTHIGKFPRSHRYGVGQQIESRLNRLLETLIRAKYTTDRLTLLKEANMELEVLRFQFRLAKDLKCINVNSYAAAARSTNEIGKLVGGWIRRVLASQ